MMISGWSLDIYEAQRLFEKASKDGDGVTWRESWTCYISAKNT